MTPEAQDENDPFRELPGCPRGMSPWKLRFIRDHLAPSYDGDPSVAMMTSDLNAWADWLQSQLGRT